MGKKSLKIIKENSRGKSIEIYQKITTHKETIIISSSWR
jgi:hypothetical protein